MPIADLVCITVGVPKSAFVILSVWADTTYFSLTGRTDCPMVVTIQLGHAVGYGISKNERDDSLDLPTTGYLMGDGYLMEILR